MYRSTLKVYSQDSSIKMWIEICYGIRNTQTLSVKLPNCSSIFSTCSIMVFVAWYFLSPRLCPICQLVSFCFSSSKLTESFYLWEPATNWSMQQGSNDGQMWCHLWKGWWILWVMVTKIIKSIPQISSFHDFQIEVSGFCEVPQSGINISSHFIRV